MYNSPHKLSLTTRYLNQIDLKNRSKRPHVAVQTMMCAFVLLLSSPNYAEIYKHTDANGNVSFSDTPQGKSSEVVSIDADSKTSNVMDTSQEHSGDAQAFLERRQQKREAEATRARAIALWRKELKAAQQELRLAKQAKSAGVIAEEGDFIGSAGGGARPSPQYFQKLEDLDTRVASAEKRLTTVRYAKPK